jgi:hypothetical protein
MKRHEGVLKEPRSVLRSGGLGKPKIEGSKPKLTLDLSSRVYSLQEGQHLEQNSSSRRKSFGASSCRSQNKENEQQKGNRGNQTARSKDMLDSYRSSRNTHYLQRNDIFKYVKPPQRDDFDFRVSTSFKSELCKQRPTQGGLQVPPSSQTKKRVEENSPHQHGLDEIAKKINFNQAARESQTGSSMSSLGLTNLQLSYIGNHFPQDGKRETKKVLGEIKNFNNKTGQELFGNRRLSGNTRSGSRSNVRNKMLDEFSDPSAIETEELLRNWDRRSKVDTTESSLKLCLSYYDLNSRSSHQEGLKPPSRIEEKKKSGTEVSTYLIDENYQVKEPSDCVLISTDDNTSSFERDKKEGRGVNLESMKTIKEVEEREEVMGYTSQKDSQQSNFNQGSFQNLIDKYCKNRDPIFLPNSGRESLERTQSGFANTQTLDHHINQIDAIQEEELNQEIEQQEAEFFQKKFDYMVARVPALSIAHSIKSTEMSNNCRDKSDVSTLQMDCDVDREHHKASPFSLLMNYGDCLKTEPSDCRSTSRGHSRSHSTYTRAEKLDTELEKILKTIEYDTKLSQERKTPNYSKSTFRKLDDLTDPSELKRIIRELEIENREKETELINMNMQVKDLSRLGRVLVRKIRSSRNVTN